MEFVNSAIMIYIPALVIVCFTLAKQYRRLALDLFLVSAISVILAVALKELFRIGTNDVSSGFQLSKYRFPSLSVQMVATFWLFLSLQSKKSILYFVTLAIVIFVAYAKLVSNQHNFLDVLAGCVIGILIAIGYMKFKNWELNAKV